VTKAKRTWFEIRRLPGDIIAIDEPAQGYNVLSYLVVGSERSAVLDTGTGIGPFHCAVQELVEREPVVVQTHVHEDHIGASHHFREVYVHSADAAALRSGSSDAKYKEDTAARNLKRRPLPEGIEPDLSITPGIEPARVLTEGDLIELGNRVLEVFHAPGHTPGGIALLDRSNRVLFAGDSLYSGNILVLDPPAYRPTIDKLASLAALVDRIYGAHFAIPTDPALVPAMQAAYIDIFEGRRDPDDHRGRYDHFRCNGFGFILPRDWRTAAGGEE
jgi:glyoxylase-like metal-dependent hydrolase (beta-lactamase superfamily II)